MTTSSTPTHTNTSCYHRASPYRLAVIVLRVMTVQHLGQQAMWVSYGPTLITSEFTHRMSTCVLSAILPDFVLWCKGTNYLTTKVVRYVSILYEAFRYHLRGCRTIKSSQSTNAISSSWPSGPRVTIIERVWCLRFKSLLKHAGSFSAGGIRFTELAAVHKFLTWDYEVGLYYLYTSLSLLVCVSPPSHPS